jgi:hypothetical protein
LAALGTRQRHRPPSSQLPLQQSLPAPHDAPLGTHGMHVPRAHRRLQQSVVCWHDWPGVRHASQVLPTHVPSQHSSAVAQPLPCCTHAGRPHWPIVQVPPQQEAPVEHGAPLSAHDAHSPALQATGQQPPLHVTAPAPHAGASAAASPEPDPSRCASPRSGSASLASPPSRTSPLMSAPSDGAITVQLDREHAASAAALVSRTSLRMASRAR